MSMSWPCPLSSRFPHLQGRVTRLLAFLKPNSCLVSAFLCCSGAAGHGGGGGGSVSGGLSSLTCPVAIAPPTGIGLSVRIRPCRIVRAWKHHPPAPRLSNPSEGSHLLWPQGVDLPLATQINDLLSCSLLPFFQPSKDFYLNHFSVSFEGKGKLYIIFILLNLLVMAQPHN